MRRPAPHHWRDQWLREPEAGQAPSGRAGQRGAERWQGLRSALRQRARHASPSVGMGRLGSCEPGCPEWAVPARAGPDLRGPQGYLTHGLCRPGRAEHRLCFAVAQVLAILPYSSRRERRGEGAEPLRVGAAQGTGAAGACSWWHGFLPLPQRRAQGLPKPKGPLPWRSCSGGIREGRGSWPFSPRGRAVRRSARGWALPLWWWLAQAEG